MKSKIPDPLSLASLEEGNKRQRFCSNLLKKIKLFDKLREYNPLLAGTIPINIDLPESDLDIICEVYDFALFRQKIHHYFSDYDSFSDYTGGSINYVAQFNIQNQAIEIYAESNPTHLQYAYIHMQIESKILNLLGETFRKQIIQLKTDGLKTEPAFGKLLGLQEPYSELIALAEMSNNKLKDFLKINKFNVTSH